jgi:hypothetical protein
MSAGGMALVTPATCQPGERIVSYLDNVGRLEGTVARTFEGGFAVEIKANTQKRERIANLLTWYINRDLTSASHLASPPRSSSCPMATCMTAASSTSRWPAPRSPPGSNRRWIPSWFSAGYAAAWCVHHDNRVAIQFAELQDPDSLARTFG